MVLMLVVGLKLCQLLSFLSFCPRNICQIPSKFSQISFFMDHGNLFHFWVSISQMCYEELLSSPLLLGLASRFSAGFLLICIE